VVRALAAAPEGLEAGRLAEVVDAGAAGRPDGWFEKLLARLEKEGLVTRETDGRLRLPG
jgi:DNA-binding IclR family transcriptional regulator